MIMDLAALVTIGCPLIFLFIRRWANIRCTPRAIRACRESLRLVN